MKCEATDWYSAVRSGVVGGSEGMSADALSKNLEVREAFVGDDPWDAVLVAGFWGIFARSLVWGFE